MECWRRNAPSKVCHSLLPSKARENLNTNQRALKYGGKFLISQTRKVLSVPIPSFKQYKKRNLPKFENPKWQEQPHGLFQDLSSRFFTVPPLFSPVFHDFGQKGEKSAKKMEERERKEKRSFPFLSRSRFLPSFLGTSLTVTYRFPHENQ